MNANQRIDDLILITGKLSDILARENDALKDKQLGIVSELLEEKENLSRAYESRLKGLGENAEGLEDLTPEQGERLKAMGLKIKLQSEENATLLKAGMEANRRLVQTVAEVARNAAGGPGVYSAQGSMDGKSAYAGAQNTAISLDQSL